MYTLAADSSDTAACVAVSRSRTRGPVNDGQELRFSRLQALSLRRHRAPCHVVHVGLQGMPGLDRIGTLRGGAGAEGVEHALQLGQLVPGLLVEHEAHGAGPAPHTVSTIK